MCRGSLGTWQKRKRTRDWFDFCFFLKTARISWGFQEEVFCRFHPHLDLMLQPHGTPFLLRYVSRLCIFFLPIVYTKRPPQPVRAALCLLSTEIVSLDGPHYPGSQDPSTSAFWDYNHRCALSPGITITGVHCCILLTFPTIYILICLSIGRRPSHELWYTCKDQRAGFLKSLLTSHLFWSRVTFISVTSVHTPGYLAHALLSLLPISQQECRNYKCMPPHLAFYMGFRGWTQVFGLAWLALLQTKPVFSAHCSYFVGSGEIPEWSPKWVCVLTWVWQCWGLWCHHPTGVTKSCPGEVQGAWQSFSQRSNCESLWWFTRAHKI